MFGDAIDANNETMSFGRRYKGQTNAISEQEQEEDDGL